MAKRKDKLDGVDADHLAHTIGSAGWQLIRQRIERAVALKVDELQQPLDPVKTVQVRGEIAGLKLALGVPAILQKEARVNKGSDGDGETERSGA